MGLVQSQYAQHYLYQVNDADWRTGPGTIHDRPARSVARRPAFCLDQRMARLLAGNGGAGVVCAGTQHHGARHARHNRFWDNLFMFGTLYFLWRTTRQLTPLNVAGTILFFALAMVSKYTTVLLGRPLWSCWEWGSPETEPPPEPRERRQASSGPGCSSRPGSRCRQLRFPVRAERESAVALSL